MLQTQILAVATEMILENRNREPNYSTEAQDQALRTNLTKTKIDKSQNNPTCRKCKKEDGTGRAKEET